MAVVVMMGNLLAQDAEARRIYAENMASGLFFGAALVTNSLLARAIGSFFLGLRSPPNANPALPGRGRGPDLAFDAPPSLARVMTVDTSPWERLGTSANAAFFEIEPGVLAVVPRENAVDDEHTAKESIRIQHDYVLRRKHQAGVIVFLEPVVEQDAGARRVYRSLPDPALLTCFALITGRGICACSWVHFSGAFAASMSNSTFFNL